ncbi:hypothetical protein CBI33_07150 [Rhodococcus erythropolis]|nr:hypothetical protein CBI33_07150 [Rhodococcus erythropolis]
MLVRKIGPHSRTGAVAGRVRRHPKRLHPGVVPDRSPVGIGKPRSQHPVRPRRRGRSV